MSRYELVTGGGPPSCPLLPPHLFLELMHSFEYLNPLSQFPTSPFTSLDATTRHLYTKGLTPCFLALSPTFLHPLLLPPSPNYLRHLLALFFCLIIIISIIKIYLIQKGKISLLSKSFPTY